MDGTDRTAPVSSERAKLDVRDVDNMDVNDLSDTPTGLVVEATSSTIVGAAEACTLQLASYLLPPCPRFAISKERLLFALGHS